MELRELRNKQTALREPPVWPFFVTNRAKPEVTDPDQYREQHQDYVRAVNLLSSGKYVESINLFNKAKIQYLKEPGYTKTILSIDNDIAAANIALGRYDAVIDSLQLIVAKKDDLGHLTGWAQCSSLCNLGEAQLLSGNDGAALDTLKQVATKVHGLGTAATPELKAEVDRFLGLAELMNGNSKQARIYLQNALSQSKDGKTQSAIKLLLAVCFQASGDFGAAREIYRGLNSDPAVEYQERLIIRRCRKYVQPRLQNFYETFSSTWIGACNRHNSSRQHRTRSIGTT